MTLIILSLVSAILAFTDTINTQWFLRTGRYNEVDPLAKPFVHPPALHYAVTTLLVLLGIIFASYTKVSAGAGLHLVWWLPQTLGIAGNIWGYATSPKFFPFNKTGKGL